MASEANQLKDKGNAYFKAKNYEEAEQCYTQAISHHPTNPLLFTNRAMARLSLSLPNETSSDCLHALELSPSSTSSMKAHYLLAQAQLLLHQPTSAHASALRAYELCVETRDRSIQNVSAVVLRAKKAVWEAKERERERMRGGLVEECVKGVEMGVREQCWGLDREGQGIMGDVERRERREEIEREGREKCGEVRSVFAVAEGRGEEGGRREVPDYLIDSVTFAIMHDPVVTKNGISYDRSTLVEHLKRSDRDPLTGEPLTMEDLRPNRALKAACEDFLEKNGWAVDW